MRAGQRPPLDFGHWSAHKLESITGHRLRHGEAVAIGMALDLTYAAAAGYLDPACVDRVLALLDRLGFALWDDVLLERDAHGRLTVLGGLQEFREHLGGSLHVTLISDIGCGFEVTEMDDQLVVDAIHTLERREAALRRSVSAASAPVRV